ncbi:hypothetical protein ACSXDP_14975 (plasmid) [Clostridium perfringens]
MLYKTHLTTSLNVAIPALYLSNELSILILTGVGLGSLLPDQILQIVLFEKD